MKRIVLGNSKEWGHKPVEVDVNQLIVTRLLVQANSGGGKSRTLRRLLEQMHGILPHVVIDLDGEFATLREKFPYVLAAAGAGGDCRIDSRSAKLLARKVLEHGFSVIVDLSEMPKHGRAHFVRLFLEALLEAPRSLWRPLLVVIDEAHHFCPEKEQAESAAAVIDLMTRGRKRGFCGVLATQRISKLNKDAAAEANNKLIGRSALDVDMKRAADELGFSGKEQQAALRNLDAGHFFAFGPAISKAIVQVKVGDVETTHPEPGHAGRVAAPPAPEKLKKVLEQLGDLPKQAEEEAGELERLRREVGDLRRKAGQVVVTPASPEVGGLANVRAQALKEGAATGFRRALEALRPMVGRLATLTATVNDEVGAMSQELQARLAKLEAEPAPTAAARPEAAPRATAARRVGPAPAVGTGLPRPRQAILEALAWLNAAGIAPARRTTLALLARQSPSSSGFDNNLGALRTAGLIDYPQPGLVDLTDDGRARAPAPAGRPSSADLHRTLEEVLPAPRWRILRALIEVYPSAMPREGLAIAAEQSAGSSGFDNNLGGLRGLGFIDYPKPGFVVAKPDLFLEEKQ